MAGVSDQNRLESRTPAACAEPTGTAVFQRPAQSPVSNPHGNRAASTSRRLPTAMKWKSATSAAMGGNENPSASITSQGAMPVSRVCPQGSEAAHKNPERTLICAQGAAS